MSAGVTLIFEGLHFSLFCRLGDAKMSSRSQILSLAHISDQAPWSESILSFILLCNY